MKPKQNKNYIVGIYARLSRDDGQDSESTSIENQRLILTKYVNEKGWTLHDVYIDDGISGTTFERPGVQKLLDDAKNGVINTIIVKDLSRFGRNYIQVGQYLDYVFPTFGIRFIAIQDNVDTANRDNSAMEMMPIMNVFNEWHAANTSKKVKSVIRAQAKDGKYHSPKAPFGYVIVDKDKRLPVIDEPAASVVRRIFQMRLNGYSMSKIKDVLNLEGIPCPQRYMQEKFGKKGDSRGLKYWSMQSVKWILKNPIYTGDLVQQRVTTVITRYTEEKKTLTADIETLNESLAKSNQVVADVDEFIAKIKRYLNVNELTRAMSVELIERVIIGATPKDKNTPRKIQIVYKVDLV